MDNFPALTRQEIAYLRAELLPRFGAVTCLAEGILLRSWKSGPHSGLPRTPSAVRTMVERGLMAVQQPVHGQPFRAFWTEAGLKALGSALLDRRAFPEALYKHVIEELHLSTRD